MDVNVNKENIASVGDIIEFNHKGSHGEGSYYLICYCAEGYFILNLSGKKNGNIKFYSSLSKLMSFHKDSIQNIYSQTKWSLAITNK